MGGPASRSNVLRPRSVSSFAAQPPEIPEPTTMASYSEDAALGVGTAVVPAGNDGRVDEPLRHGLGSEVREHHQLLERGVAGFGSDRLPLEGGALRRRQGIHRQLPIECSNQSLLVDAARG